MIDGDFRGAIKGTLLAIILKEIAFVAIFGVHTINGSTIGLNIDGKTIAKHLIIFLNTVLGLS